MKHKFTFKKGTPPTGLSRITWNPSTHIKVNKVDVGIIRRTKDGKWKVSIQANKEDAIRLYKRDPLEGSSSKWRWLFLKQEHDSEEQAREYIKKELDQFLTTHNINLYLNED